MLTSGMTSKRTPARQRYGCSRRWHSPIPDRHTPVSGTRQKVEAVIWAYTRHLFSADTLATGLERYMEQRRQQSGTQEAAELRKRLVQVEQRIAANVEYAGRRLLPADMLEGQQGPLVAERERLLEQVDRLGGGEPQLRPEELRWLREVSAGALERLEHSDYGRQLEFLLRVYDRIELHRDRLVFHHRLPLPPREIPIPARYYPRRGADTIQIPPP